LGEIEHEPGLGADDARIGQQRQARASADGGALNGGHDRLGPPDQARGLFAPWGGRPRTGIGKVQRSRLDGLPEIDSLPLWETTS
jgi:hypothetical protein